MATCPMLGLTMATKKRKPRKQTSDRVSSIAATLIAHLDGCSSHWKVTKEDGLTVGDVRAVCMSVLAQDEVKGKRGKRG